MSSIRIKVQLGDEKVNTYDTAIPFRKFVYFIDSPSTKTIDELIRILQEYIIKKFSCMKTQIVELMTDDGYILSKTDICSNVIKDNDHIICIDMRKFIEKNQAALDIKNLWLELKQHDASDNQEKFIRVGLNHFSELYIRMYGASNGSGLYIFGIYDLFTIASEKRRDNLIAQLNNTNDANKSTDSIDCFLESKWEYDAVSNKDLFIICNLKVGSSDQVLSNKLHILLDHSRLRIQKGEITTLSSEVNDDTIITDQQRQRLKELASKLPPPKQTGPQIALNTNENLKLTKHECEGESSVRMAYGNTNTVTIHHDSYASGDGAFSQYFVITHIIFSKRPLVLPEILNQKRSTPVDKPVSVVNLTVLYQIHDGSWRECQDVAIAPIPMRDEEPKWLTDTVINIEPDKLISFVIKGWMSVKGEPGRDDPARRRVHKSLPQPLKLKIVITDTFAKQCSLVVEKLNKPLELETRESFLKKYQSSINELLAFVSADDPENDERICMSMYVNVNNKLVIKNFNTFETIYERKGLRTMEFNAKKNKTTEVPLVQNHCQNNTHENNAITLFDPETYILYAIRLEISTKTSKTEETVLIPMEKIK